MIKIKTMAYLVFDIGCVKFHELRDTELYILGWQPYSIKELKRLLINQTNWLFYNLLFESIGHPVDRYNMYYDNGENELSPGSMFFQ